MMDWRPSPRLILLPAIAMLLVALYALLGFWALPKFVRGKAIDYVAQTLHRELSIGQLRFNPFTFELDMRDVAVREPGAAAGSGPLVAFDHAYVDFQLSSLWRRAYVFRSVLLEKPYVRAVVREDGSLNLADLVPPSEDDGSPTPALEIGEFTLRDGQADFADHSRRLKPEKTLAPINFSLRDFRTTAESGGFQLTATSRQGERFDWSGKLNLQPLTSSGSFKVAALQARSLYEFLSDELPMELSAGTLDLAGTYAFSVGDGNDTQLDLGLPRIQVAGLALRAKGQAQDWFLVPAAALENTRVSLRGRSVAIDALRLQGLSAKVWLERDGSVNLARLFGAGEAAPAVPAAAPASTPAAPAQDGEWTLDLGKLALEQGDLDFEDRSVSPVAKFHAAPLALEIDGASLDLSKPLPLRLQGRLNGQAQVAIDGTVVPDSAAIDWQIDASGLALSDLKPYLPHYPNLVLKSGSVGAKGRFRMRPASEPGAGISFDGDASLSKLDLADAADKREFLSWDRLDASGIALALGPDSLSIRQLRLRKPYARVNIAEDGSINLVSVLSSPADAAAAPASGHGEASSTFPVKVGKVLLENGTMGFADHSIEPNFQARIDALNGSISGLSTDDDAVADIDLKGQVINRYSPVTIKGGTNLFAYDRHTDIDMVFRNIDLPIFNPYSGRFAGYAIAKGKLTTELHYRIDDRRLQAEHHVILDQLEWGDATDSKDKVSLPVRLATSLLKDRHGVIDLSLPVSGSLDDPQFRVGPIVWQVIKNILSKAVTAPFSFLGSLFGGAEEAQYVDFAPGSAELSEDAKTRLAALAKGLVERPALRLDIPAGTAAGADADALALAKIQHALAAQEKAEGADLQLAALAPERQVELLGKLYRKQTGEKPEPPEPADAADEATRKQRRAARDQAEAEWLRQQLLARYQPGDDELIQLGRARADAIQDALLGGGELAPERVFVSTSKAPVAHEGAVRLELGLE